MHISKIVTLILVGLGLALAPPALAGGDWNDAVIKWQPHEEGLALAKKEKKPVCLVVYTDWCPHCENFSKLFHDPAVSEKAKQFVMIRVDKDKDPELSKKYAPDGEYIPRTFFLSSAGELDPEIHELRDQYKYFYDEKSAKGLAITMSQALKKLQ